MWESSLLNETQNKSLKNITKQIWIMGTRKECGFNKNKIKLEYFNADLLSVL